MIERFLPNFSSCLFMAWQARAAKIAQAKPNCGFMFEARLETSGLCG
jgi:hypothetical protein